jgi:hypothetical protein
VANGEAVVEDGEFGSPGGEREENPGQSIDEFGVRFQALAPGLSELTMADRSNVASPRLSTRTSYIQS